MDSLTDKYFPENTNAAASLKDIAQLEAQLGLHLPSDFTNFLLNVNGFEGFIEDSNVVFAPVQVIHQVTLDYCSEFFPGRFSLDQMGARDVCY